MKVKEFKVSYDSDTIPDGLNYLLLDSVQLSNLNLLVGKNASGKTSVINILSVFPKIFNNRFSGYSGKYSIKFSDGDNELIYDYTFPKNAPTNPITEHFSRNGKEIINREGLTAKIFNEEKQTQETITPPPFVSVIASHRDARAYPYFEQLINWAESVYFFDFGLIHPNDLTSRGQAYTNSLSFSFYLDKVTEREKQIVISDINSLGYKVEKIGFAKDAQGKLMLQITEQGVRYSIEESAQSQGMFRSMWLLLYIQYLIDKCKASLIIIDDLCEGLDYSRATALGKLLFKKMQDSNVQFIATSNDRFLMNVVDIKYWNILVRKGDKIQSYNYFNSKEKFDEFKLIGLNNFDLFTSDFLEINQE